MASKTRLFLCTDCLNIFVIKDGQMVPKFCSQCGSDGLTEDFDIMNTGSYAEIVKEYKNLCKELNEHCSKVKELKKEWDKQYEGFRRLRMNGILTYQQLEELKNMFEQKRIAAEISKLENARINELQKSNKGENKRLII